MAVHPPALSGAKSYALGAGAIGLALLMAWLGVTEIEGLVRAVTAGAPIVTVVTGAGAALPAVPLFAAAATMLMSRHRDAAKADRRDVRLFTAMLVCLPLMLGAPLAFGAVSATVLEDRGYRRCLDVPMRARFPIVRWWRGSPAGCAGYGAK